MGNPGNSQALSMVGKCKVHVGGSRAAANRNAEVALLDNPAGKRLGPNKITTVQPYLDNKLELEEVYGDRSINALTEHLKLAGRPVVRDGNYLLLQRDVTTKTTLAKVPLELLAPCGFDATEIGRRVAEYERNNFCAQGRLGNTTIDPTNDKLQGRSTKALQWLRSDAKSTGIHLDENLEGAVGAECFEDEKFADLGRENMH